MKTIGITIVSHNSYEDLLFFFNSFMKYNSPTGVKFLIVETSKNNRIDDLEEHIDSEVNFQIAYIPNNGYAYACNYGLSHFGDCDILILSNADIVFTSEVMKSIRKSFNQNNYGSIIQKNVNGRTVTFDLYPQFKSLFTELLKVHRLLNKFQWYNQRYVYIVGAFMIFGRNIIEKNGLFDENFFLYCEETDYYYRLRNNNNALIIKDRYIIHTISSSIGKKFSDKGQLLESSLRYYYNKHKCAPYVEYWKVSIKITVAYAWITNIFFKKDKKNICL
ncbi:glycosyltransferase family 2 protein [Spirosoma lituiforme]